LFAQSITEVHGIAVENPDRARALVMTLMMGSGGVDLVQQLAKQAGGQTGVRNEFWGTLVARSLPAAAVGPVADQVKKTFLKHFLAWTGSTAVGRLMPFGIGAVIGGAGNNILGRRVVRSARTAFGPPPREFPAGLEPHLRMPKPEKTPKPAKAPKPEKTVRQPNYDHVPQPPKPPKPQKPVKPQKPLKSSGSAKRAKNEAPSSPAQNAPLP
jgi:hypothetical protein